jgi:nitrite reductase (NO-forming)
MKYKYLAVSILAAFSLSLYSFEFKKSTPASVQPVQDDKLAASVKRGEALYTNYCSFCHQPTGVGIANAFPPLAKSDYLMADTKRAIDIVKNGKQGEITVNGQKYNGVMPPQALTDEQVADVLNYVRNTWGNKGKIVTLEEVKAVAKK